MTCERCGRALPLGSKEDIQGFCSNAQECAKRAALRAARLAGMTGIFAPSKLYESYKLGLRALERLKEHK